jgi:hypothetical protein
MKEPCGLECCPVACCPCTPPQGQGFAFLVQPVHARTCTSGRAHWCRHPSTRCCVTRVEPHHPVLPRVLFAVVHPSTRHTHTRHADAHKVEHSGHLDPLFVASLFCSPGVSRVAVELPPWPVRRRSLSTSTPGRRFVAVAHLPGAGSQACVHVHTRSTARLPNRITEPLFPLFVIELDVLLCRHREPKCTGAHVSVELSTPSLSLLAIESGHWIDLDHVVGLAFTLVFTPTGTATPNRATGDLCFHLSHDLVVEGRCRPRPPIFLAQTEP